MTEQANLHWHAGAVVRAERERLLGQCGCVLWFTGLSGSGKSTVARALEQRLVAAGRLAYVLDGDNLRHGLNASLGFSPADREENIRRVGEVAALFGDAGVIALVSFISPYARDRDLARAKVPAGRFLEVYVNTPLAVCEARDPKGLYRRARAGELPEFTGVSAPYEAPALPEVELPTAELSLDACVERLLAALTARGLLAAPVATPDGAPAA